MTAQSPTKTRIKICGITSPDIAQVAVDAGADFIGLVFAEGSPRQITDFDLVRRILDVLPPGVQPVGVFAHPLDRPYPLLRQWTGCGEWCQLHGRLEPDALRRLAEGHRVIRGFHFDEQESLRCAAMSELAALLIDGPRAGSGRAFDHRRLAPLRHRINKPIFLAGGLTPDNVALAIGAVRPYAVDVSSGVESSRGVKDPILIRDFCRAVRAADKPDR